jgi:hypothetical protein
MNKMGIFMVIILLSVSITSAKTPAPASFFGHVFIENSSAVVGTTIEVKDSSNISCGTYIVQQIGVYGLLICNGDDPQTSGYEGAVPGANLSFYVDGKMALTGESIAWESGVLKETNLNLDKSFILKAPARASQTYEWLFSIIGIIALIVLFLLIYNKK